MLRLHSPFTQNIISGLCVAFTAGIYVALNILGAGGGRPDSQSVTSIVNSCSCACWFVTSFVGSIIMQYLGPGITTSLGVLGYAVYANAFHNNLRTRCLLGFVALVVQVPCGFALQALLDHKSWRRRSRAFAGLSFVGMPLTTAWIWEIIRVHDYDRHNPPKVTMDWTDDGFAPICVLFVMKWVASSLWQYLVVYWLGALSNDPLKAANYSGIWRGVLAAGEAIIFGADSTLIPFEREVGALFALYATGILIFAYLAYFHIQDTLYFTEDRVVVPNHIIEEIGEEKAT